MVGATGTVGREIVQLLADRLFPVRELRLFEPGQGAGELVEFAGGALRVELLECERLAGVEIAFFSAGEEVSRDYAPAAVAEGAVVIDSSGHFQRDPLVPLVVPEVNAADVCERGRGIVASPSGGVTPIVVALKPIADAVGIDRVVVNAYQAVSGAGKRGIETLARETFELLSMRGEDAGGEAAEESTEEDLAEGGGAPARVFPRRIAFNCFPQVDALLEDGSTKAETDVVTEMRKVMHLDDLPVAVTCVRAPVFYGDAVALVVETTRELDASEARRILRAAPGVLLCEDGSEMPYPTPADVGGTDAVYVGRVRDDPSHPRGLQLWVAADNVRKGAALNAVQIAEIVAREL